MRIQRARSAASSKRWHSRPRRSRLPYLLRRTTRLLNSTSMAHAHDTQAKAVSPNTSNPIRLAGMFFTLLTDLSTRPERRHLGRRTGCLQNRGTRISGFSYALARRHSEIHSQVSSNVRKAGLPDRQRSAGEHLDYRSTLPLSWHKGGSWTYQSIPRRVPSEGRPAEQPARDR